MSLYLNSNPYAPTNTGERSLVYITQNFGVPENQTVRIALCKPITQTAMSLPPILPDPYAPINDRYNWYCRMYIRLDTGPIGNRYRIFNGYWFPRRLTFVTNNPKTCFEWRYDDNYDTEVFGLPWFHTNAAGQKEYFMISTVSPPDPTQVYMFRWYDATPTSGAGSGWAPARYVPTPYFYPIPDISKTIIDPAYAEQQVNPEPYKWYYIRCEARAAASPYMMALAGDTLVQSSNDGWWEQFHFVRALNPDTGMHFAPDRFYWHTDHGEWVSMNQTTYEVEMASYAGWSEMWVIVYSEVLGQFRILNTSSQRWLRMDPQSTSLITSVPFSTTEDAYMSFQFNPAYDGFPFNF